MESLTRVMRSYNRRPEARPRRTPIVGQRRSHGQTIAPNRFVFGGLVRVLGTLNRSHASQLLLQLRFGMLVGLVERLGGVLKARETDRVDAAPLERQKRRHCRWFLLHRRSRL